MLISIIKEILGNKIISAVINIVFNRGCPTCWQQVQQQI